MKKVALVFTLAVIAPSLVLAWLAVRSLRDQEFVADRQQTLLYQNLADSTALAIAQHLGSVQRGFAYRVENLFKTGQSRQLAEQFDARIRSVWPLAEVGFAVSLDGGVLAPSLLGNAEGRKFRAENDRFLCSTESCEVYWNSPKGPISLATLDAKEEAIRAESSGKPTKGERTVLPTKETGDALASKLTVGETNFRKLVGTDTDGSFARFLQDKLHVMFWHRASDNPQLLFGAQVNIPKLTEELWEFVRLSDDFKNQVCLALLDETGKPVALSHLGFNPLPRGISHDSGPLPAGAPRVTVGKKIPRDNLAHNVVASTVLTNVPASAFISANGRADWKHPFVAAEIGEVLPHWEVAVYLLDPAHAVRSASAFKLTLGLLVALLVLAIAVGSWLIVADLNRQLRLTRQKTDFVSNVSHELKTPLTSIRMFTEMLAEDRVQDDSKRRHFLGIITAETARLTRLINNVLDFARLERGEKKHQSVPFDLAALVRETVESYRPHLENIGFTLRTRIESPPAIDGVRPSSGAESQACSKSIEHSDALNAAGVSAPGDGRTPLVVQGDRDAMAQVLVNLLSNAEKYSGERKEIEVALGSSAGAIELRVSDHGLGVPSGCEEKIFDQFYRAHDSLDSGIQGSGLGLTLARQIARAHGGDVTFERRESGGSCFLLKLPGNPV